MDGRAGHDERIAFLVTDEAWMANPGRPLTEDDVVGLCGLGASSKTDADGIRLSGRAWEGVGLN